MNDCDVTASFLLTRGMRIRINTHKPAPLSRPAGELGHTVRVAYAPAGTPSSLPQTAQQQVSPYCISGDAHPSPTTRIACHPSVFCGAICQGREWQVNPARGTGLGFQWLPREYVPRHLSPWWIAPFYASISFYWRMCAGMAWNVTPYPPPSAIATADPHPLHIRPTPLR
jgi:hypothetical protein